jgi:hypothetical protein
MKIIKGKWQTGNLYDALIADKVDVFFNLLREMPKPVLRWIPTKEHNYEFKWK